MKPINKTFLITLILIFSIIQARGQQEYRRASINISVPAIVENVKKTLRFDTGKVTENTDEQKTHVGLNVSVDDMQVNGNNFSGLKVITYPVSEEVITFNGVFSDDHEKIESINIEQQYVKYNIANRSKAHIEEKKTATFIFKNVPKKMSGYSFDHELTEISEAKWYKYRYLKYRAISETTVSKMIAVDKENINKWTQCIRMSLRTSNYTAKNPERNKVAVITSGCGFKGSEKANKCGPIAGIHALLNLEFSKTPGLKVLEREHLDVILKEQELSASGLVDPNQKVESGKIIEEDILVIIQLQEPTPEDPPETHFYKILVEDKQSGKIIDTGISYRLWTDKPFFDHFVKTAYAHVMKNYLM